MKETMQPSAQAADRAVPKQRPKYPYPGLRPFSEEESEIFFGRFEQVAQLIETLRRNNFLSVVGPSGCGKSSLIYAGLLPKLNTGLMLGGEGAWRFAKMRPGARPMAALADALVRSGGLTIDVENDADRIDETGMLYGTLQRGPLGLIEALEETPLRPYTKLLLLVDQFEELFRYSADGSSDEADALVRILLETARHAKECRESNPQDDPFPVYIVLTMRTDYLGECNRFPGLPEAINDCQFLTPRMTRDQRRAAITGPAYQYNGRVKPDLVNQLLNDMGDEPDQLPIMQHALMRMWTEASRADKSKDKAGVVLTSDLYNSEVIGGWNNTLSNHADNAFEELDERGKRIAEKLFRCLSEPGPDGRGVRRPVSVAEVTAVAEAVAPGVSDDEVKQVIEKFQHSHRNFLVMHTALQHDDQEMVDISHESLIRHWGKLRGWLAQEALAAREYEQLERRAFRKDYLQSPALDLALKKAKDLPFTAAWARRYGKQHGKYHEQTMSFLRKSKGQHVAKKMIYWAMITVVSVLILMLVIAFGMARVAEQETAVTQYQMGRTYGRTGASNQAVASLLTAAELANDETLRNSARRLAAGWARTMPYELHHDEPVGSIAISPNRDVIATICQHDVYLWESSTGNFLAQMNGEPDSILGFNSLAFGRKDSELVFTGFGSVAQLWDARTGKKKGEPIQHDHEVVGVTFGAGDKSLITATSDGIVSQWDVDEKHELIKEYRADGRAGPAMSMTANQDGSTLAWATDDGTIWVWTGNANPKPLAQNQDSLISSVVLSDDGELVLCVDDDGTALIWQSKTGELLLKMSNVVAAAISHQNELLLTAGDRNVQSCDLNKLFEDVLWRLAIKATERLERLERRIKSDDGVDSTIQADDVSKELADLAQLLQEEAKTVQLEDDLKLELEGLANKLDNLAQLPPDEAGTTIIEDAKQLEDISIQFEDLAEQRKNLNTREISVQSEGVTTIGFGPDGQTCLVGGSEGTFWLMDARTGTVLFSSMRHTNPVSYAAFVGESKSDLAYILTRREDSIATLWRSSRQPLAATISLSGIEWSFDRTLAYDQNEQRFVVLDSDTHKLRFWEPQARKEVKSAKIDTEISFSALSANGRFALIIDDDQWQVFDTHDPTRQERNSLPIKVFDISSVAVSSDGLRVAIGLQDGRIQLMFGNADSMQIDAAHTELVEALVFALDGKTLISGSRDQYAKLWNADTGERLSSFHHRSPVTSLAISANGERLITGGDVATKAVTIEGADQRIPPGKAYALLWSTTTKERIGRPILHSQQINQVALGPEGQLIGTATSGLNVRLWDALEHAQVGEDLAHASPVTSIAFNSDASILCATLVNGDVSAWPMPSANVLTDQDIELWIESRMSEQQWREAIRFNKSAEDLFPEVWE